MAFNLLPQHHNTTRPETEDDKVTMMISNHAADDENHKPVIHAAELGEEGAQRIELMQEVWGKHGKLYIFLAYEKV